jgi:PiT family inorganic phosphate transporter
MTTYVILIIVLALIFDFLNGFHDAANSIATVVSTRVLTPGIAVIWAAAFNFIAVYTMGLAVAATIGKGIVTPDSINNHVILSALVGAIAWNLLTWWLGLPTSSSHALVGGLVGAAVCHAGLGSVVGAGVRKTVLFIFIAPLVGLVLGYFNMVAVSWIFRRTAPSRVDRLFRRLQIVSAAAYSLGHGANDAQKTMGIIAALFYATLWRAQQPLFEAGKIQFPFWIVLACHLAISLGTLTGGWRIVKTMGMKITKLRPYGGACAETAAAVTLFVSARLGVPVSTTHTITGAIVGVGTVQRFSAVRWGIARRVVWAWVLTIPMSAIVGALCYWLIAFVR